MPNIGIIKSSPNASNVDVYNGYNGSLVEGNSFIYMDDCTHDGTYWISINGLFDDEFRQHNGNFGSAAQTYTSPGGTVASGVGYDGSNALVSDINGNYYQMVGVSASVDTSFSETVNLGNPIGIASDGTNLLTADDLNNKLHKCVGFSSTIDTTINSPGSSPSGVDWLEGNLYSSDRGTDTIYKHSGFSTTIDSSWLPGFPAGTFAFAKAATPVVVPVGAGFVKSFVKNTVMGFASRFSKLADKFLRVLGLLRGLQFRLGRI